MLTIHTVLHPTDFSERSEYALSLACSLARDHGARLVLLHAASAPPAVYAEGVAVPFDYEGYLAEQREQLKRLKVPEAGLRLERRFEEGDPDVVILRVAQEIHADLIVMGTHGRTGLARLLMGSVAEYVVRHALCPVLTVKTPFPAAAEAGAPAAEQVPAATAR